MYTATTKFLNQTRKNYNYKYNDIRNIWTYIGDFLYMCRRWLLWITEYGVVRLWGMYNDSVDAYLYYNIPLWQRFSFYFIGEHQLLFSLGYPLDLSYLA